MGKTFINTDFVCKKNTERYKECPNACFMYTVAWVLGVVCWVHNVYDHNNV